MSQRRDDTTEPHAHSPAERERTRGSYYDDDATGYEPYDPTQDNDDDNEDAGAQPVAPARC